MCLYAHWLLVRMCLHASPRACLAHVVVPDEVLDLPGVRIPGRGAGGQRREPLRRGGGAVAAGARAAEIRAVRGGSLGVLTWPFPVCLEMAGGGFAPVPVAGVPAAGATAVPCAAVGSARVRRCRAAGGVRSRSLAPPVPG